uniref:Ribonuclease H-like domain-containing protein n=1 Tax=Tanacetum cinerariifolium TaxID=118510 RepID=A0A6L2M9Y7_TANCI|nr:ribonuclease H-like domain-containing protein [Tanacetum cinerariifolium]
MANNHQKRDLRTDHPDAYKWIEANEKWLYDNFDHCEVETSDDDDDAREALPEVGSAYATSFSEESHRVGVGSIADCDVEKIDTANVFQDINHIDFFDCQYPEMLNNDERVDHNLNGDNKSQGVSSSSSKSGRDANTAVFLVNSNSKNDADGNDDIFATQDEGEPKSFFEASKYPHWTDVMNQEMDALLKNDTWEIIKLHKGRKAIRNVNNPFLYVDLDEIVYMKPPEGYFPSGNKVCRLKKFLYELKQAPRQWNAKLTSTLIENGFNQSKSDYSLYTKSDKGVFLALLIYVDDIIITGNNVSEIEKFKVFLKSKFMIKDLGKLKYFLGIEVIDTENGICLNQRKYVLYLLSEYGMFACKPVNTPLMSMLIISNEATKKDHILDNITDYQRLMGKLIYLTNTRPDISYDVHCLSQFMHSFLKSHLKTTFKILRYLKDCPGLGIHIIKDSGMSLNAYFDTD